ncbi:MAG: HAD family hydrolase [Bacteroidota bacterium]|nr:HAD family hydrolase [Bacteroidota bacterium]
MIKVLLFDAANTLIFKPDLLIRIATVLEKHQHLVDVNTLRSKHKLVSEIINFPDRTDRNFYEHFNTELILSLGILPNKEILDDVFTACSYLPWEPFEDCKSLNELSLPKCVLSNFNSGLNELMDKLIPDCFTHYIVSESVGCRKPDIEFYNLATQKLGVEPHEIVYFGDSLKLDVMPAQKCGMNAILIDRFNEFTNFKNRISTFEQIPGVIDKLNKQSS